jgi:hypothetical protein
MAKLDKFALFASVRYKPHDVQRAVHASTASRRILCSGVRLGKSTLCVHEVLAALLAPGPATRGWIVTPTAATTDFAHRVVELDERERRAEVRNLSGAVAIVEGRTADRPASLLGASLDWVVIDEAARLSEGVWATLSQRLVDRRGWALICSTPRGVGDWFHREHLRGARGDEGYASWSAPTWSNPSIDPATVLLERSRLTPGAFAAEYGARFIGGNGAECATCGWGRDAQRTMIGVTEWRESRRCEDCMRPVNSRGEPIGFAREDGTIGVTVVRGPEDHEVVHPMADSPVAL